MQQFGITAKKFYVESGQIIYFRREKVDGREKEFVRKLSNLENHVFEIEGKQWRLRFHPVAQLFPPRGCPDLR